MNEIQVVKRVPVKRNSIQLFNVINHSCVLQFAPYSTNIISSCGGTSFIKPEINSISDVQSLIIVLKSLEYAPHIYVSYTSETSEKIFCYLIKELSSVNIPLYIVTTEPIPESAILQMSTNPYNIIQATLSCIDEDIMSESKMTMEKLQNLQEMFYAARTCGIHTILRIEPIIPTVMTTYKVMDLINSIKNSCNHISLKFFELEHIRTKDNYLCYKGWKTPKEYYVYANGKYVCSPDFIKAFIDRLKVFTGKKTVSVCGSCGNCQGINMRMYKQDNEVFSILSIEDNDKLKETT